MFGVLSLSFIFLEEDQEARYTLHQVMKCLKKRQYTEYSKIGQLTTYKAVRFCRSKRGINVDMPKSRKSHGSLLHQNVGTHPLIVDIIHGRLCT